MDTDGLTCFVGTERLANDLKCSRETVEKHLDEAAKDQWITWEGPKGRGYGMGWEPRRYRLTVPKSIKEKVEGGDLTQVEPDELEAMDVWKLPESIKKNEKRREKKEEGLGCQPDQFRLPT